MEFHVDDLAMDKIYLAQPWESDFHIQTINSISQLILKYLSFIIITYITIRERSV